MQNQVFYQNYKEFWALHSIFEIEIFKLTLFKNLLTNFVQKSAFIVY
jgi:hypothetical protein